MQSETTLVFGPELAASRYGMLQCTEDFVALLKQAREIRIAGSAASDSGGDDDRVQFYSDAATYKIVRVNLPTTMLLATTTGLILKEAQGYLAVQLCRPDYKIITQGLQSHAVTVLDYRLQQQNIDRIVQEKGQTSAQLSEQYKISPAELREFMDLAGHVQVGDRWLVVSPKLANSVFHSILTHLTERGQVTKAFEPQEVRKSLEVQVHPQVFASVLHRFGCVSTAAACTVPVSAIVRFVLSEMSASKQEFVKGEFDSILSKLLGIYLPAGMERPKELPEIAEYFLEVHQNGVVYTAYNVLELPQTPTELVQLLSKIKLRYSYNEIVGLFRCVCRGKNIEEALIRHFRKYSKDYELKAVLTQ